MAAVLMGKMLSLVKIVPRARATAVETRLVLVVVAILIVISPVSLPGIVAIRSVVPFILMAASVPIGHG
jgi:hypothetical protein